MNFNFEPVNFIKSIPYMAKGMFGILAVIAAIIIAILILNKATEK